MPTPLLGHETKQPAQSSKFILPLDDSTALESKLTRAAERYLCIW